MRALFFSESIPSADSATESAAVVRAETWRRIDHCPHCRSGAITKWGRKSGNRRFRCAQCSRTFSALTNTGLAHLRHRERWISFIGAMIEHKSLRDAAVICGISLSTAQRWRNRLLGYIASHGFVGLTILDSFQEMLSRL